MLPDGRRLGAHLPLGHGMVKAAERAAAIGADTLQVFSDNPTAWHRRSAPPVELPAFRTRVQALGLGPLSIHASYLINLAGSDDELWRRSIDLLVSELRVAPTFGARFLNIHIGSHRGAGTAEGMRRVGAGIAAAFAEVDESPDATVLVLENSAGAGDGLGVDVPELAGVLEACVAHGVDLDRLGFCLDTAHAWGAGHRLGEPEGVDAYLDEFDDRIGLGRLRIVHLNDSRAERGSRTDRHEHLGKGMIGVAGMRRVLTHPGLAHVTYYLETPGMDEGYDVVNLARARAIAAGEALEPFEPLQPDPSAVPSGRGRASAGPPADE
jgi:deoxyribonuclease-4